MTILFLCLAIALVRALRWAKRDSLFVAVTSRWPISSRRCLSQFLVGGRASRSRLRKEVRNLMGTLMIDFITSLDGYGAAAGWPGWWGMQSAEYLDWLGEQPEHTLLMGATTYRLMSGFAASGEEGVDEVTQLSKVVFSSTLTDPLEWANTQLVTGDAVQAVRAMKAESPIEMRTLGSVSLCRSLIKAELVDRFRVVVFPVVTGATGQDRIYDGYPDVSLDLVESRTFEGGLQLLEYVPTVLVGPPGTKGAAG
jgi:dihydrofolate reductase